MRSLAHSEAGQHQRRALRLVELQTPQTPPDPPALVEPGSSSRPHWNTEECSRTLVVFHKEQVQGSSATPGGLRQPPRVSTRSTEKRLLTSGDAVEVPRFTVPASTKREPCGARLQALWNIFTADVVPHIQEMNTQLVKLAANRWRL
ncbi:hypothetical protein GWK47_031614 [Chionoecetes opilio]|uniref:Uncharacterized protein n=1 Tax=Chionoecetes opilio TaxID=41210 RepID=A0A8J4YWP9_CHIOP|nr:hypothetical protein GWK47_031614 [Chionoecetes opilio]